MPPQESVSQNHENKRSIFECVEEEQKIDRGVVTRQLLRRTGHIVFTVDGPFSLTVDKTGTLKLQHNQ